MFIYEVEYPFEVDYEEGSKVRLYPTMKAADADIRDLTAECDELTTDGDIVLTRVGVCKITREVLCHIINTRGGGFVESRLELRRKRWTNPLREKADP